MARWIKSIKLDRKPTGIFCKALVGDAKGKIGEVVYYHRWGGLDLQFEDGSIATFANDDVQKLEKGER